MLRKENYIKKLPVSAVVAVEDALRRALVATAITVNTVASGPAGHWSYVTDVSLVALPNDVGH